MPLAKVWLKAWIYWGLVCGWVEGARPRFDTSTDMGLVLIPADAEVDSVIFRLRATDQDADYPLVFEVTATITPVVRIDNLPCTLFNKVCQANVILTKRLMPGRLHDFAVRVRDTKGDSNSMQATISATNATTSRDKIFPHIPSLIMVPEDTKPGKELDYLLVRANSWSGKPVYIELWQPKDLFTIRQRQTQTQTRGVITLIGELDFETQSMYTLTIYATDPYTEPGKDTRNIAGLNIVVVVQDVQDVPPIFTLAPPLTRLNNSVQTGDIILRVHAEDGDKGVPREITYGLVSEGNPFVPFFNISETTGEIALARPLEELTQITHVGAPVVLSVVAEEIRRSRDEPPAQATVVEVGFLLGEPGNSPPYFENDKYITSIPENLEPGSVIIFPEQYSSRVRDEDIGKAGVFALKLQNNNGTFEISPTVAERTADFIITVRDNTFIDYEMYKSLSFEIIAQEVGPATNLSASAAVVIFIQDLNDNSPVFDEESYEVTLSENVTAGTRVIQVHATDKDTGLFGNIKYTGITGRGSDAFAMDPDTGLITVAMGSSLDREMAAQLQLTVNARDENGIGNTGTVPLIVNLLDVNDNAPVFAKDVYEFMLNSDLTNFTTPAFIKATDVDAEPPNNEIRYELIHGNYENKFYLNEITGELMLRSPITKFRRKKQSLYSNLLRKPHKGLFQPEQTIREIVTRTTTSPSTINATGHNISDAIELKHQFGEIKKHRRKRESDILYTLTARAYDLGVPHLASETRISIIRGSAMEARIMMFVVPGEHPNLTRTAETLAAITGGRVSVLDTRPYVPDNRPGVNGSSVPAEGKRTIVVARVEQTEPGTSLVDVEKIRNTLAANGFGIIGEAGTANVSMTYGYETTTKLPIDGIIHVGGDNTGTYVNKTISNVHEEVTVYKAENKLLFWLLIILGLLMLLAIAALIICCICPGCPFYMAPRKRRVYSSETLIARSNGRPKRHLHRRPMAAIEITSNGKKQAWSADPTRRNWQFNRRNTKNGGLASLPGDVVYISERPPIDQANAESLRLRDGPTYDPSRRRRIEEQERMYVEDVEERKVRDYDATEADSLQRHEIERGSDILRQDYRQRYVDPESNNEPAVREQHFYREGNAEVLQLVTRGQVEDDHLSQHSHYPTTLIIDGKDVLLQRFMQDQKARHEVTMQEPELVRTVESHQRPKNLYQHQQEILLLPEELELRSHRHVDEMGPGMQKMAMDDTYETQKMAMDAESHIRDVHRQEVSIGVPGISSTDRPAIPKEHSTPVQSYAFHDLELARQNALLTRLLLERESRHAGGAIMMDAASYLETQSLPGQVAIATQTDRAAATQTERQVRSRSDNDESDEESRSRKKTKKKRYGESESKRTRTLWMKSPIEEEESECFDKRLNILRKKVKEVKEGRRVSLEPKILREISDSLDENGSSYPEKKGKSRAESRAEEKPSEESSIGYKVLGEKNGSSSSTEVSKQRYETIFGEKRVWSSPEISIDNGQYIRKTTEKKSSRKESRVKKEKKVESVIKPSFRILEREITMLTKKLSKLADKKIQQTTGDDSTSQEKSKSSKDSDQSTLKTKTDERKRSETSPSRMKEAAVSTKTRQKFKYQQPQIMSPGSSEYDDTFDKPKKSKAGFRQEVAKHKQASSRSHTKVKRQTQTQIERKEHKKQVSQRDREVEKRKDVASKESALPESKTEKPAVKLLSRAQKLAAIGRRENIPEEHSTSTSSDRVDSKKDSFTTRDSDKKSTESSDVPSISHHVDQREPKRKLGRVSKRFTDDFVTERQMGSIDQENALHSAMGASIYKEDIANDARDAEIMHQFSDDFTIDTRTKEVEHETPPDTESKVETGRGVSPDFRKEHVTLKKVVEDVAVLQDLEYAQLKDESTLDAVKMQQTELFKTRRVKQIEDSEETVPLDSTVQQTLEEHRIKRSTLHCSKCADREKLADMTAKHVEEMHETLHETETGTKREEVTPEKEVHELQVLKDDEKSAKKEVDAKEKHVESPKMLSDSKKYTEQVEEEEQIKPNGFYSDANILLSKIDEDSKDIKEITGLSHSNGEDKTAETHVEERNLRGKSRRESKQHSEEEAPSAESTVDTVRKIAEELVPREIEDMSLHGIKSDMEKETKIITTDSYDHQDAAKKLDEILEKPVTSESELEKAQEDEKLTIQMFEEVSGISQPSKSEPAHIIDIHPASVIEESDKTLTDVHEASQEISEESSIQTEPGKITDVAIEDTDTNKVKHVPITETKIGSYEEISHISSQEPPNLQETKLDETDKTELSTSATEVTTSRQEVADTEQSQAEHSEDVKEESLREEQKEEEEESLKIKERFDEKMEEALDKDFPDELREHSKDLNVEKSAVGQVDTVDKAEIVAENVDTAGPQDQDQAEQRVDVSDPIFSSIIDTLEISEESDSSSDVSRKTTLTTRPYDTPRHRQKWQQQESLEIAIMPGIVGDEKMAAEIEAEEDTDSNISLEEIESVEDSTTIEEPIDDRAKDAEIATERFLLAEKMFSGEEEIMSVSGAEKIIVEDGQDRDLHSKFEEVVEMKTGIKGDIKEALTTIQTEVTSIVDITGLKDASRQKVEDESMSVTKEHVESTGKTPDRKVEEVSEKPDDKSKIRSLSRQVAQVDSREDGASVEDAKGHKTEVKDVEEDKTRSKDSKSDIPSISERHAAKKGTFQSPIKRKTKPERSKVASPLVKKRILDEESETRATSIQSRRRSRRDIDGDSEKQKKKDVGPQKQSRKEEEPQRKQVLPRTKSKTDKKPAIPVKTGEIDMSKTRSKYMAWYNKKREEAEKKKLEKKAAEDEELPRWVSRSLRHQTTKSKGRLDVEHKTPEMTPRTRRKIKPLVNVESEQLKAIVRQGRQLRRAEGNLKEDPPIQIFTRTPPVSTSDTQPHRLLQHSEYKYEKVPPPFYLHPPPAPHPSPQLSPERSFEVQPSTSQCEQSQGELRTDEIVQLQSGGRLRHQQLLEKKSVFDIAYSEAAPSQLRSDSATPPS